MSHAAGNPRLHQAAFLQPELTPAPATFATHDFTAVERACAEIYSRWCRFVPDAEAREQAEQFRRRFETLATVEHLSEAELDAILAGVGDAMAAS